MHRRRVVVDYSKCRNCVFCSYINTCYSPGNCTGCMSCYWSCPRGARRIVYETKSGRQVNILFNGMKIQVSSGITVTEALKHIGFTFDKPGSRKPSLSCKTGGCWSYALVIDGALERSCITPIRDNMVIETNTSNFKPLRIIHGPEPHRVGGKATPWWEVNYIDYVEAAI